MDNETNSVADFLNTMNESSDLFSEKQETSQEETQETQEIEEKQVPFHRDPKVQRYVEKQIEKALKDKPAQESRSETAASDVKDVIDAFTAIIGNDTPDKVRALEKLEKTLHGSDERASQKAIERFQQQLADQKNQETEAEKQAQDELDSYFDDIEDTYNVDLTSNSKNAQQLRSQFIEYVRRIAPKDANGEVRAFPDMIASFEDFQDRQKKASPTTVRAKGLASRGLTRSNETATAAPQGRSWKDVDRYFDTLQTN